MRFNNYLTEKWFDTAKYSNLEIFKNPSRRDYKDLQDSFEYGSPMGYRVFIDLKKKNVYIFLADSFHKTMLDNSDKLSKELKMNWYAYWSAEDKTNEYIIMGDCNQYMTYFNSDSLMDIAMNHPENGIKYLRKMMTYDFKWLSKYGFKPDEVYRRVEKAYEYMEDKMNIMRKWG